MSRELIKQHLAKQDVKPEKRPVTVYLTEAELSKLDDIVAEFKSSRTVIVEAMINVYTKEV